MKLLVKTVDIWRAELEDRPGALAEKLAALYAAKADLEFVLARRTPESPGKAVIFLTPLKGAKQLRAGAAAGFAKTQDLHAVRVEGANKPGAGAKMGQALAAEGLNLRGLCATVIGKRFVAYIAADTAEDAAKVAGVLKRMP
jgi:hypothetical protein